MGYLEIFLIGVGLSMDAFAVSICKGLSMRKLKIRQALIIGLYFGGFQALMPLIGYLLGASFENAVNSIAHWIAFVLLVLIGGNMIKESREEDEEAEDASVSFKTMIVLAIATSIDALAVGITFAFYKVAILSAIVIIGLTTFVISIAGVKIGNLFGTKYKSKAEIAGGIILILIGCKILIEHFI